MSLTNGAYLRRILRIRYSQHVSNTEVRRLTDCPALFETNRSRRLYLFGLIARAGLEMDHCRVVHAAINTSPRDWRGRPAHTWTRTVEADLKSCNIGLHFAWHRAHDRNAWSRLVQQCPSLGSALDDDGISDKEEWHSYEKFRHVENHEQC